MYDHFSSIYSAVQDVPLILAPQFSSLKPVTLPPELKTILGDLQPVQSYDFRLERYVITQLERERLEAVSLSATRAEQVRALQEERIHKQKLEARKIAPGYLDTNCRILTPIPASNSIHRLNNPIENNYNIVKNIAKDGENGYSASDDLPNHVIERLKLKEVDATEGKSSQELLYNEFEQDSSLNPWDSKTFENDFPVVQESLIGPKLISIPMNPLDIAKPANGNSHKIMIPHSSNIEIRSSIPQQQIPSHQSYAGTTLSPVVYNPPSHIHPNKAVPYSNSTPNLKTISNPSSPSSSLQLQSPLHYLPSSNSLSSSSTRTIVRGRSASHSSYTLPPPSRPPKEELPKSRSTTPIPSVINDHSESFEDKEDSEVLKQLTLNMGFSREEAIDALEKYDYNLEKATNYLLDNVG
ncbi:hypothetical protein G9A89_002597 [Geosiphon pyriformis]|nr:hypothetical protein G9A89_002597 [Geosiphon pyriformis]